MLEAKEIDQSSDIRSVYEIDQIFAIQIFLPIEFILSTK